MDIVHHALIGGAGYFVLSANDHELAGVTFMAGSVLPDLDVLLMAFGKRYYLKNHQGFTHSLILSPVYAFLISYPLSLPFGFKWSVLICALLGLLIHYVLDLTNTFGITLFWPFNRKKLSYDAIFFIDAFTWMLTIGFLLFYYFYRTNTVFLIYLVSFISYVVFKFGLRRKLMNVLHCNFAIPDSFNPFKYYILEKSAKAVKTYQYNVITGRTGSDHLFHLADEKYINMAKKSEVFNDMSLIAKFLYITDVVENNEGTMIEASDLGVRNFGGKFGRTTLKFDRKGDLVSEVAYI